MLFFCKSFYRSIEERVAGNESLIGGCLPRARPQLTWSRSSLDQVDLRLALFPQASPPNAHRGINRDRFNNPFVCSVRLPGSQLIRSTMLSNAHFDKRKGKSDDSCGTSRQERPVGNSLRRVAVMPRGKHAFFLFLFSSQNAKTPVGTARAEDPAGKRSLLSEEAEAVPTESEVF
ncbi:hypothetical protein J2Z58_002189 [Halobacillus andaensis]|nr:hypothetical protein [Halobacillus andaensis]